MKKQLKLMQVNSFPEKRSGLRFDVGKVNQTTRFIKKIWLNRRELFRVKGLRGNMKCYFRYLKGGVKKIIHSYGKLSISRVKPESVVKSNHPKEWIKINNGRTEKFKYYISKYGGSIVFGNSRFLSRISRGMSKRIIWTDKILGYRNRSYQIITL